MAGQNTRSQQNEPHKVLHRQQVWVVYRPSLQGWHLNVRQRRPSREHQRRCVPWDRQKDIWLGKCEMPRLHNRRLSNEHHGQTAPVCAVLAYMDPNNIPFNALIVAATNSNKTQYLVRQLWSPFRGKFDYMVLICPTFVHNKTYDGFVDHDSRIFVINCPLKSWTAIFFPREHTYWLSWTIALPRRTWRDTWVSWSLSAFRPAMQASARLSVWSWKGMKWKLCKRAAKRFCDQLDVVVCGWRYGTALQSFAGGCQFGSNRSQIHRFWERTCKGNWTRTWTTTLQRIWLRTCKNFHLVIYMAEKSDAPVAALANEPQVPDQVLSRT